MESHCAEKRTSKASTINFCIISFLKVWTILNAFPDVYIFASDQRSRRAGRQLICGNFCSRLEFCHSPSLWELCSTGHFTFSFRLFYSAAAEAAAFNLERYIKQKLMNHPPTLMKFAPLFILGKQQNIKTLRFVTKVPFWDVSRKTELRPWQSKEDISQREDMFFTDHQCLTLLTGRSSVTPAALAFPVEAVAVVVAIRNLV